jgi:hypothetical protein
LVVGTHVDQHRQQLIDQYMGHGHDVAEVVSSNSESGAAAIEAADSSLRRLEGHLHDSMAVVELEVSRETCSIMLARGEQRDLFDHLFMSRPLRRPWWMNSR